MALAATRVGTGPDWGVDAPERIRGFALAAAAGLALGFGLLAYAPGLIGTVAGCVALLAALAPLTLGAMMSLYALVGKRRFRDWMLARHDWRGDETVLDVGAGRGLMAVGTAKNLPRGRVIAVDVWRSGDLSGNGPEALAANARIEGVAYRIDVRTCDARALDLPDASVDVVLSVLCIHNIEPEADRATALAEIVRVLKPGGRALVADYVGASGYAETFAHLGLEVAGPVNAMPVALSLMWLVEARKPA
jgi:SAM-dependent methyltransferase